MPVQFIRKVRNKQPNNVVNVKDSGPVFVSTGGVSYVKNKGVRHSTLTTVVGRSGAGFIPSSLTPVTNVTAETIGIDGDKALSFFVLVDEKPVAASRGGVFGVGHDGGAYDNSIFLYQEGSDRNGWKATVGSNTTTPHGYGELPSPETGVVWFIRYKSNYLELWRNGKFDRYASGGNTAIPASAQVYVGSFRSEGTDYLWNTTPEYLIGVFNRYVSEAEIKSISANPWQIFEPEVIPLFFSTVTAQYARPTSDVSAGTWTASSGSDLFSMLDETAANDADYIVTTGTSTCEVALGTLSDPASSSGHIVRYRIAADSGGIIVRLRQGTTTIATWTHASAPTSLTTYEQTLTGGEADSITDYSALRLQFEAT